MTRNHLLFCVSIPGGVRDRLAENAAMCGTWSRKRKKTMPTQRGGKRRRTEPPRKAESVVHGGIFGATAADPLGIPGRIRSLFTAVWASQGEFARHLRHSGHPRASSLAARGLPKPRFPKVPDRSRSAVLPLRRGWRSHMDYGKTTKSSFLLLSYVCRNLAENCEMCWRLPEIPFVLSFSCNSPPVL